MTSFVQYVLDALDELGRVQCRTAFGGQLLFVDGCMFGLLLQGRLYLRADAALGAHFAAQGATPWTGHAWAPLRELYEVPADVLGQRDLLLGWARLSADAGWTIIPDTLRFKA